MSDTPSATEAAPAKMVDARGYRVLPVAGTQMYSALLADRFNRIYMATCDLRRPAYLIRLDPATGVIERLGHMQDVTGECKAAVVTRPARKIKPGAPQ